MSGKISRRYIAFLRAINVGGHRVKMDRLRALFEELRFRNVETFIASGNVIFETASTEPDALERRIGKHLEKALGYAVAVFLRTPDELVAIAAYVPFPDEDMSAGGLHVVFLGATPDAAFTAAVNAFHTPADRFHVHGREIYWYCRTKFSESLGFPDVAKKTPATARNINMVRKLAVKYV
ncbi:MAG: DUF1697 domain-containing protein [Bryobacterales bacterium]|nr:DUF1697 domain-containing protein [Bryobacterales bacterium]